MFLPVTVMPSWYTTTFDIPLKTFSIVFWNRAAAVLTPNGKRFTFNIPMWVLKSQGSCDSSSRTSWLYALDMSSLVKSSPPPNDANISLILGKGVFKIYHKFICSNLNRHKFVYHHYALKLALVIPIYQQIPTHLFRLNRLIIFRFCPSLVRPWFAEYGCSAVTDFKRNFTNFKVKNFAKFTF